MHAYRNRWLLAAVVLLGGAACAQGAAPYVESRSAKLWTGVIQSHEVCVHGVAVSPDGNTLVTTGDRKVALWDLRNGKLIRERSWGKKDVLYLPVFVSGGKEVACVLEPDVLILDVRTLKTRATLKPPRLPNTGYSDCLAASPAGERLAVGSGVTLVLWDVAQAKIAWHQTIGYSGNFVNRVALSPDGKVVAASVDDREPVRLHDAASGRELRRLAFPDRKRSRQLNGLTYTIDGRFVAGAHGRRNLIHLWGASSGDFVASMEATDTLDGAFALATSPDGKTLVASCDDGELRFFELATGTLRHWTYAGNNGYASPRATFCPRGRLIRPDRPRLGQVHVSDWRRGTAKVKALSEEESARAWDDLGSKDAKAGFRAVSRLLATPERDAISFLERVRRVEALSDKRIARMIADLDDDDLDVREQATADLKHAGGRAEKALRAALAKPPSPEVKKRAATILANLTPLRPERLRFLRAVEVLEAIGTPEARKQLECLAGGAAGLEETEDARAALARLRELQKRR